MSPVFETQHIKSDTDKLCVSPNFSPLIFYVAHVRCMPLTYNTTFILKKTIELKKGLQRKCIKIRQIQSDVLTLIHMLALVNVTRRTNRHIGHLIAKK